MKKILLLIALSLGFTQFSTAKNWGDKFKGKKMPVRKIQGIIVNDLEQKITKFTEITNNFATKIDTDKGDVAKVIENLEALQAELTDEDAGKFQEYEVDDKNYDIEHVATKGKKRAKTLFSGLRTKLYDALNYAAINLLDAISATGATKDTDPNPAATERKIRSALTKALTKGLNTFTNKKYVVYGNAVKKSAKFQDAYKKFQSTFTGTTFARNAILTGVGGTPPKDALDGWTLEFRNPDGSENAVGLIKIDVKVIDAKYLVIGDNKVEAAAKAKIPGTVDQNDYNLLRRIGQKIYLLWHNPPGKEKLVDKPDLVEPNSYEDDPNDPLKLVAKPQKKLKGEYGRFNEWVWDTPNKIGRYKLSPRIPADQPSDVLQYAWKKDTETWVPKKLEDEAADYDDFDWDWKDERANYDTTPNDATLGKWEKGAKKEEGGVKGADTLVGTNEAEKWTKLKELVDDWKKEVVTNNKPTALKQKDVEDVIDILLGGTYWDEAMLRYVGEDDARGPAYNAIVEEIEEKYAKGSIMQKRLSGMKEYFLEDDSMPDDWDDLNGDVKDAIGY